VKKLLKRFLEAKSQQSPVGKITRNDLKQSVGFGVIIAPLVLYGHSIVGMIHGALPSVVQGVASTDMINGIVGFGVGSVVALAWKFMRHYE